ncbi:sulfate ABC transporter permease subunit CysT [Jatrophihabitans telluris]|uniref:Sulfate transport system permease protein CysT n=1 Tax=Jatrophihabitans telluris TaxID=2038343 RepID=A0ABY4QUM1_9ACTN|nr:sulfate ABC transporter permease subunit CysT [Jatrophihabitans telluris]UQX86772.1 sulfate ABC transporter permease subunit CysT [Jatrophihabitans telluris]
MSSTVLEPEIRRAAPDRSGAADSQRLGLASGVGLGLGVIWLSLLVALPLAAVVAKGTGSGWTGFTDTFTDRRAFDAIQLTVLSSLGVALINAVMGTVIAWVLVRDHFPGKRILELLIDIPFALPTIVAGLVLLTLYGPHSAIAPDLYATKPGIVVALLFVTLPFVVRTVEPVLLALESDVEEAATSLGASSFTTFRRIVLPAVLPAVLSGAALAFGRAMGEYGSVVLISGQLTYKTEIASLYIYKQIQDDALPQAAATATVLLLISVVVIGLIGLLQQWAARRG